jgi:hypothetical protein
MGKGEDAKQQSTERKTGSLKFEKISNTYAHSQSMIELNQRAHSPQLAAGSASELYKIA